MKVVYIILAILIIGGGAWLVFGGTDASSTKAGETELPVNDNAAPAAETPQAEPGDTPAPADEEEIGSDVGMEYPALEDSGIDEMVVEEDDGAGDGTFPAESRTLSFSLDAFNFGFSENERWEPVLVPEKEEGLIISDRELEVFEHGIKKEWGYERYSSTRKRN